MALLRNYVPTLISIVCLLSILTPINTQTASSATPSAKPIASRATQPITTIADLDFKSKLEYDTMKSLFEDVIKETDSEKYNKNHQMFLKLNSAFIHSHPNILEGWILRAKLAVKRNYESEGRKSGYILNQSAGISNICSKNPDVYKLIVELNKKGWMSDPYKLEKQNALKYNNIAFATDYSGYYWGLINSKGQFVLPATKPRQVKYWFGGNAKISPLISVICEDNIEAVKFLINQGQNINGNEKDNPLANAAGTGNIEMVKFLLNSGATVKNVDVLGTPSYLGHVEIVKLLLERGADPNKSSPLVSAANGEIIKLLLDAGANVNQADEYGNTALQNACREGHLEIVRLLLNAGANINQPDSTGYRPLWWAKHKGHQQIRLLLESAGAY